MIKDITIGRIRLQMNDDGNVRMSMRDKKAIRLGNDGSFRMTHVDFEDLVVAIDALLHGPKKLDLRTVICERGNKLVEEVAAVTGYIPNVDVDLEPRLFAQLLHEDDQKSLNRGYFQILPNIEISVDRRYKR